MSSVEVHEMSPVDLVALLFDRHIPSALVSAALPAHARALRVEYETLVRQIRDRPDFAMSVSCEVVKRINNQNQCPSQQRRGWEIHQDLMCSRSSEY